MIFRARQKTQINLTNPIESKRSGVNCLIDPNYPQKEKQQSDSLSLLQLRKTPTQFQSDKIFKFFDERFKQSIPTTGIESFTISFNPLQSNPFPLEYYQSPIFEVKLESPLLWIAPQGYFNISMRNPQFSLEPRFSAVEGHEDLIDQITPIDHIDIDKIENCSRINQIQHLMGRVAITASYYMKSGLTYVGAGELDLTFEEKQRVFQQEQDSYAQALTEYDRSYKNTLRNQKHEFDWKISYFNNEAWITTSDAQTKEAKEIAEKNIKSSALLQDGIYRSGQAGIIGINGMNCRIDEVRDYMKMISGYADGAKVDWVYNHSNSVLFDVAEICALNFYGISPNTKHLFKSAVEKFHQENLGFPNKKLLAIFHSQGNLCGGNGLSELDIDLQQRVVVLGLAPPRAISKQQCAAAINLASEKDIVPYGDLVHSVVFQRNIKEAWERMAKVILLEPHLNAEGIDHNFLTKTWQGIVKDVVEFHNQKRGDYSNNEFEMMVLNSIKRHKNLVR